MHFSFYLTFIAISFHAFSLTNCRRIAKQEPEVNPEPRIQRSPHPENISQNLKDLLNLFKGSNSEVRSKRNDDSKKNMALLMSFINKEDTSGFDEKVTKK